MVGVVTSRNIVTVLTTLQADPRGGGNDQHASTGETQGACANLASSRSLLEKLAQEAESHALASRTPSQFHSNDSKVRSPFQLMEKILLESKLQPEVPGSRAEDELKLKLISADIEYYSKKMELAELHTPSPSQGDSARVDLKVATAKANEACFVAEEAFWELVIAFPNNEAMERPAAPEERRRYR